MISRGVRSPLLRSMIVGSIGCAMSLMLSGCSGGDAPSANASSGQKSEKPAESAAPAQPPKVAPRKASPKDRNDLSPRERREQAQGNP